MTIVFFARYFYPHIGGVEKHVFEIASRLIKNGHRVIVVAEMHDRTLQRREECNGIVVYRIPITVSEKEKKYQIWQWLFKHRKLIRKADIIHCHDVFYWYLPFRFIFPQKKVFTTFHGYEGNRLPTKKAIFMHKISEILSSGNIVVGDYISKWYHTKSNVITYGAVQETRKIKALQAEGKKEIQAVFVGRLEPEASLMGYLRVMTLLSKKDYRISLTVVGDGSQRKNAETYVKQHKLSVIFVGFQKNVSPFLQQAEIIFTSRFLSTLEAFIEKKYVFCLCNNTIHRDCFLLSPFAPWMTTSDEPRIIMKAIIAYTKDQSLFDEKIIKAHAWAKKQTWNKLLKQYETLWFKK
jgi:glycosyltransferase involved in cell wall biosynthesis